MDYNLNPKLEKVLKKLLEPDFKIKNEVYLNQLLTHITDQSATSLDSKSIDKETRSYYVSWLKTAIEKWDTVSTPRQNFLTFGLHLAAFVCSNEQTFVSLNCENVFERLAKIGNRFNSPSVKLANIKLLTAFLEHKSGLQWVISTNSWNDVLTTALNCPTVYISKEACLFLTRLLEKSIDMNEAFCSNIMYLILIPLKLEKTGIDEESYYLSLKPSLLLIANILELLLQRATVNCAITKKILAKFNLEKHLIDLKNTQNKNVFFDVYTILHLIGFFELLFKFGGVQEPLDFQKISQPSMKYCGITEKLADTLSNPQMLCFLGNSLRYWSHIRHKMTLCVTDGSIPMQFENQLMILQLLPVAMISMRLINPNPDNLSGNDDIRDMFFTKIIKNSLPNTFRVVYKWKARFPNQTSFSDASMGLKYFLHSKQHYSRDVANSAFQMLLYTLRDVTDVVKEKPQMVPLTGEAVSFLVLLLTAIVELIKGFSLTWKDSVETVAVLEIAFNCLNFPTWPAKQQELEERNGLILTRSNLQHLERASSKSHSFGELQRCGMIYRGLYFPLVDNRVPNARVKELLVQWLKGACKTTETCLPPNVLQFAIDITSELCADEMVFVILNAHHVFETVLKISKDLITKQAAVQLSYIRMMKSFVQHKSGVQWIMSYSSWTDIVTLIHKNPVVNVFNGSCEVLMLFLEKVADLNYDMCSSVILYILAPLRGENIAKYRDVNEDNLYEYLQPTLDLLFFVLRWLLDKIIVTPKYKLVLLFLDTFKLNKVLTDIKPTRNKYLIFKVHQLLGYTGPFTFIRMFHGVPAVEYSKYDKLCQECLENFYIIAETKLVKEILECNYQFMMFWLKYKADGLEPVMVGSRGKLLLIEDQILLTLLFIISPRVSTFFMGERCDKDLIEQDEIRDQFLSEVFSKCTPQTVAMCYKIHQCWPKETIFKDGTLALNYILIGRKNFTLAMANTTVQFAIYSLKDITHSLKERPQMWESLGNDFFKYMTLLLDTMVNFFKEFNITWREITETISVLDIAFCCLVCYPHWPQNVVVKGLELVDVAISKYMSPNMALLIDKVHDSVMGLLGPMLYAKLHDIHWEVRDSALEVICTITRISNKKFPSYRKVIQEADFPCMVLRLAKKDTEAFVRASALKCLKEMIQVEDFWWDFQSSFNIFEEILNILLYEAEGIVRSEAATVVATIYEHHDVPESYLGNMYDVASHAATADLHWEVKAKALMFWSKVIEKHLTHQGMIDGTFPEVTFSKENRKIVTLNDAEVKKRLIKVLDQLSATGCLAVFAAALQDDSDLEVAKTALDLIKEFVVMLKKYKVTEQDLGLSTPASPLDRFSNSPISSAPSVRSLDSQYGTMSPSSDVFQMDLAQSVLPTPIDDAILESILDSEDIGLLDSVSSPSNQVAETVVNLKTKEVMLSRQFLNFIYGDLDGRLKERSRWLEQIDSFDSLLDDILKDYQVEGINSMDCY